jgi:hypothetical protein
MMNSVKETLRNPKAALAAGLVLISGLAVPSARADETNVVNGVTFVIPTATGVIPPVAIEAAGANAAKVYFPVAQINPSNALVITANPFGPNPRVVRVIQYAELMSQPTGGEIVIPTTGMSGELYSVAFGPSSTQVTPPTVVATEVRFGVPKFNPNGTVTVPVTPVTPTGSVLPDSLLVQAASSLEKLKGASTIRYNIVDGKITLPAGSPTEFIRAVANPVVGPQLASVVLLGKLVKSGDTLTIPVSAQTPAGSVLPDTLRVVIAPDLAGLKTNAPVTVPVVGGALRLTAASAGATSTFVAVVP